MKTCDSSKHAVVVAFLLPLLCNCSANEMTNVALNAPWFQISPAYWKTALDMMLQEVNLYARRMQLHEEFPIATNSLTEIYIAPAKLARRHGGLGNLHTTNYSYAFARGNCLTYIIRLPKDKSGKSLYERFKPWKIDPSAVNTNAAFTIATQMLATAYVDVPRLLRSATVSIRPVVVLDMTTSVYDLQWKRGGTNVAEIGVDGATKELWQLRVEDPSLIVRKPLQVADSNVVSSDDRDDSRRLPVLK